MSKDLNKCTFIGRLGQDPKVSGTATKCSIACGWKTANNEGTEWVNIVSFGKLAEIMAQYLKKGSKVYIEGSFKTTSYEKDGSTRYSTEIVANEMIMLDSKSDGAGSSSGSYTSPNDDVPF